MADIDGDWSKESPEAIERYECFANFHISFTTVGLILPRLFSEFFLWLFIRMREFNCGLDCSPIPLV